MKHILKNCSNILKQNKVLTSEAGPRETSRGEHGAKKFSLPCGVGWKKGKIKSFGVGVKTPSFGSTPPPPHCVLSSLNDLYIKLMLIDW